MAKRPQYSVLQGLVRDIERALEESGTEEWKLLSTFDNLLFAIEEADVSDSADVEDAAGCGADAADDDARGSGASGQQLDVPGTRGVEPDVPRGTLSRAERDRRVPVPLVDTSGLSDDELMRVARSRGLVSGGKEIRRGSTKPIA